MSYIFGDLKTKLQTQVDDPNLTDSIAGDALNYTQNSLFNTFDLTLNSSTQTNALAAGATSLTSALPTDFQRVYSLYITSPTGLSMDITRYYESPKDFRINHTASQLLNTSPPISWTYFTSIEFAAKSDQAYTIKLDYIKSITVMSVSSDAPTIPQAFEELLILGAKMRIYEQKEDFDYASQFSNRYADQVEAFITRYGMRQVDNQVVIPGSRTRQT